MTSSCNVFFGIFPKNATLQTQAINLCQKNKAISEANFLLDCRWIGEYFLINYSYLFLVNQQPAPWPPGGEDEKEFPEGAHTKT
jgi:hypothetical protein